MRARDLRWCPAAPSVGQRRGRHEGEQPNECGDEERGAKRPRRGAAELVLEVGLERGGWGDLARRQPQARERRPEIRHPPALCDEAAAEGSGELELRRGGERRVEHDAGDCLLGGRLGAAQVGGEDRGEDREAEDDAGMAGGDRPTAVERAGDPVTQSRRGERVDRKAEAETDQKLRSERPREARGRQQREAGEPAGDEDRAGDRLRPRPGAQGPKEGSGRQRSERNRRDGHRRHGRRLAPAVDDEEHEQEQRRGESCGEEREGEVREHVRAVRGRVAARGLADRPVAEGECGGEREDGDWDLDDEDRPPGEGRGQQTARDGTQRGPGNAGDRPPPRARQLVARRGDEELKAADERKRAPDSLERPGRDKHGE